MMQRILTGFSDLPGADQAYIISRKDGLVAAVGKRGRAPMVEYATKIVKALDKLGKSDSVGKGLEFWSEGDGLFLLTRMNEDACLVISGKKGGRIARWRHAVECDIDVLNSMMR
ncbi:MAG: hypothetical protein CMB55_02520 [Euryarchaeota archaeon]|nr:hypothetical protein [Euryarchaeota archaeon]|tara:strand:+ start:128 stop:469 length:342 start_codon:yes stop_codon:yes gene_type:complete